MSPLRTAVVGYGLAGSVFHAPLISAEQGMSLNTIVTSNAERAAHARARYRGVCIVPTVDELLADTSAIDLVVIATPTPDHAAIAARTIEHRIATVVDKPLAVHAADAERLIEAAAAAGVLLTVFQNRRWDGDFLTVTRLLSEGTLGDIYRFESRFEWLNPRPRPAWKTGTSGLDGGGVAYDLGAHLIDQALQLFGPPTEVYGELLTHSPGAVNDDDSFIAIHHESGVRSHLWMSSHVAQRGPRFRVLGSASAYTKWGLDQQESQLASGMDPNDTRFGVSVPETWGVLGPDGNTSPVPTERGRYTEFYAGVVAAITGGGTSVDPRDAVAGIRMIEHLHAQRT